MSAFGQFKRCARAATAPNVRQFPLPQLANIPVKAAMLCLISRFRSKRLLIYGVSPLDTVWWNTLVLSGNVLLRVGETAALNVIGCAVCCRRARARTYWPMLRITLQHMASENDILHFLKERASVRNTPTKSLSESFFRAVPDLNSHVVASLRWMPAASRAAVNLGRTHLDFGIAASNSLVSHISMACYVLITLHVEADRAWTSWQHKLTGLKC